MWMAEVDDVGEHPFLGEDANDATDKGRYDLDSEHHARGDFHVMSNLQVSGEAYALSRPDVRNSLEDHVGDGTTGEDNTGDHFMQDVEGDLLIGDGLDHSERNRQNAGKSKCEEDAPDWELRWEDLHSSQGHGERKDTNGDVPPLGDFGIGLHETGMDISLVL